jgi:hypothetical protein
MNCPPILHRQRAGCGRDGVVSIDEFRVEGHAGTFRHGQPGNEPRLDRCGIALRHVHIEPEAARVRDGEQLGAGAAARIDQRADIGFARGDNTVKRRCDAVGDVAKT